MEKELMTPRIKFWLAYMPVALLALVPGLLLGAAANLFDLLDSAVLGYKRWCHTLTGYYGDETD